jgi:two-component system, sensor histidine kinase
MGEHEYRVLMHLTTRRDLDVTRALFEQAKLPCDACESCVALAEEIDRAVGAIVLTDNVFQDPQMSQVLAALERQPPWSDVPAILLCRPGIQSQHVAHILASLRNVTVLERPTTTRTLISSVKAAIRARARQYQMREQFNALRASEAALRVSEDALQAANQRKDEFLAMLAHELRNPLAPIRNASEILERKLAPNRDIQPTVSIVKRQAAHLARLVDDLLDVSRITMGRIELRRGTVEVAAVVAHAIESVEPLIREKGQTLLVSTDSEPLYVDGDQARLVQSVGNVLTNAAKYTDREGEIRVAVQRRDRRVVIAISDNGVGMSEEVLPRIFDLFVQGDRSLDRSQGGLGIGLSVVRRLIEMHDGEVSARSDGPGLGSTFEISLPAVAAPVDAVRPSGSTGLAPKRILIVDDNADAADSLALLLQLEGHRTEVVYCAKQALERALSLRPEVVLLDIGLPEMNGYEVALKVRAMLPSAQLIALTGYGQAEDIRRALSVGFDAHVVKPVDFSSLGRIIRTFGRDGKPSVQAEIAAAK